jgi:hypothetical protein
VTVARPLKAIFSTAAAAQARVQHRLAEGGGPGSHASPASTVPLPHVVERRVPDTETVENEQGKVGGSESCKPKVPWSVDPSAETVPEKITVTAGGGEANGHMRVAPTLKLPVTGSIDPEYTARPLMRSSTRLKFVPLCAKIASSVKGFPANVSCHDPVESTSA